MQEVGLFLLDLGARSPALAPSLLSGRVGPSSAYICPSGPPGSIQVKSVGLPGYKLRLCDVHSHTPQGPCLSPAVFHSCLVIVAAPGALSAAPRHLNPPHPAALAKRMRPCQGRTREGEQNKSQSLFCNLISEVASHHFCCILFIRNLHSRRRVKQGCE